MFVFVYVNILCNVGKRHIREYVIYARLKIKPFVFVFVDLKLGYAHRDVSDRLGSGETVNCCINLLKDSLLSKASNSYQPYPYSYP